MLAFSNMNAQHTLPRFRHPRTGTGCVPRFRCPASPSRGTAHFQRTREQQPVGRLVACPARRSSGHPHGPLDPDESHHTSPGDPGVPELPPADQEQERDGAAREAAGQYKVRKEIDALQYFLKDCLEYAPEVLWPLWEVANGVGMLGAGKGGGPEGRRAKAPSIPRDPTQMAMDLSRAYCRAGGLRILVAHAAADRRKFKSALGVKGAAQLEAALLRKVRGNVRLMRAVAFAAEEEMMEDPRMWADHVVQESREARGVLAPEQMARSWGRLKMVKILQSMPSKIQKEVLPRMCICALREDVLRHYPGTGEDQQALLLEVYCKAAGDQSPLPLFKEHCQRDGAIGQELLKDWFKDLGVGGDAFLHLAALAEAYVENADDQRTSSSQATWPTE